MFIFKIHLFVKVRLIFGMLFVKYYNTHFNQKFFPTAMKKDSQIKALFQRVFAVFCFVFSQSVIFQILENNPLRFFNFIWRYKSLSHKVILLLLISIGFLSSSDANAQCTVNIKPTVSGCYQNGGSKATVSVEIAWMNAPAGETITVSYAGQTRSIKPGLIAVQYPQAGGLQPDLISTQTIVSPQVVDFEISLPSSATTITANFSGGTCIATPVNIITPAACAPIVCPVGGIGGMVFNDYNADGVKNSGEVNGVPNATVTAYGCDGTKFTTSTDANGQYTLNIPASKYPLRVEFTGLSSVYGQGTINGTDGRTSVQFVKASNCNVNLGVNDPADFCQTNPLMFTPCFVMGNPLAEGTSKTADALVGFPYANTGGTDPKTFMIEAQYLGTVWAQAYQRDSKTLFSAATVKRHAGLGPGGLDAIYLTSLSNPLSPGIPTYINLSTLSSTINVGTIGSNVSRDLKPDKKDPSADAEGFLKAGKVGIGGIALNDDQSSLWVLNINENKVHELNLSTYNTTKNKADITFKSTITIPSADCVNGQQRSWALNFYKGAVYAGSVCDGSSGTKSDMRAYVHKYDVATSTWSKVFDFPLTYPKGYPLGDIWSSITGWFPWTDTFSDYIAPASNFLIRPQPIFSDIEFDTNGSMVIAFGDRSGTQGGYLNYDTNGQGSFTSISGGDILRVFFSGGTYILENAAKAGSVTGYGPTNDQGPGFGEFYNDDVYNSGITYHTESSIGGLAIRAGSGEVVNTAMDPLSGIGVDGSDISFSAGVRKYNNTTGNFNSAYRVYQTDLSGTSGTSDGTFGKTQGLGDITLGCDLPTFLEIGNRVWKDNNRDGVQDACEESFAGIKVSLYKAGVKIAETTTNADGDYYFSTSSKIGAGTWIGTGADSTLIPKTNYDVVFGETQIADYKLLRDGINYDLTVLNSSVTNANDLNDSDAFFKNIGGGSFPTINVTTGVTGSVNHTLDVGFVCNKLNAGSDQTFCQPSDGQYKFADAPSGQTWTKLSGSSTIDVASGQVLGLTVGVHEYILSYATSTECADTVKLTVNPVPSSDITFFDPECTNGQISINASFTIVNPQNVAKYDYSGGSTFTGTKSYASLPNITPANSVIILPNPTVTKNFTIRLYNMGGTCFTDKTVELRHIECPKVCPPNTCLPISSEKN